MNIVRFDIVINLTFRKLFNIHFEKWSKVTIEDKGELYVYEYLQGVWKLD